MTIDLDALSLKELKDLQSKVEKAIAGFHDRKKQAAIAELEDRARALGFSLSELTGTSGGGRKRAPAKAKYRNPANAADTWSGRGRKPRWFEAALKAGKKAEDLAI